MEIVRERLVHSVCNLPHIGGRLRSNNHTMSPVRAYGYGNRQSFSISSKMLAMILDMVVLFHDGIFIILFLTIVLTGKSTLNIKTFTSVLRD